MKIFPTQQSFTHKTGITRASRKLTDRMTFIAGSMIATTILGSAYMCKDRDYYQSREAIKSTNTINMDHISMDALIENIGLEGLKITSQNNKFSYTGKLGAFKNVSGTFIKSKNTNQIFGTYKEDGIFNDKEYSFNFTYNNNKSEKDDYTFAVEYTIPNKPESKQTYSLTQKKGASIIYKNGKILPSREEKEAHIFAAILAILATANLVTISYANKNTLIK